MENQQTGVERPTGGRSLVVSSEGGVYSWAHAVGGRMEVLHDLVAELQAASLGAVATKGIVTELVDGTVGVMGRGAFLVLLLGGLALIGAATGLLFGVNGPTPPIGEARTGGPVETSNPPDVDGPGGVAGPDLGAQEVPFSDADWKRIQEGLRAAGFYAGEIDGRIGPGTRGAIRNWQTALGLEATSYLDEAQGAELVALALDADADAARQS